MAAVDSISQERMDKARRYLRIFMRDTPAYNRLIRRVESEPELIDFAIEMAISDWNSTMPPVGYFTIANYPSLYLLIHGAAIQLLKTQGLIQSRNELSYNAGGSSFMRSNKTNYYLTWMNTFANDYEMKKRNVKLAMNVARGWGGIGSEYGFIAFAW